MTCHCEDTRGVRRRSVLKGAVGLGALAAASGFAPARYAFAAAGPAYTGDTLVVISQRGAADWLSLVPPLADPDYAPHRPTIAIPAAAALQLDSFFGLHPAMGPLLPYWKAGQLAVVHAVGNPDATRSHFDAQRLQELAGSTTAGWIDRAMVSRGSPGGLAAVQLGSAQIPLSQLGSAPVSGMTTLGAYRLTSPAEGYRPASSALAGLYHGVSGPAADAARDVLATLDIAGNAARLVPSVAYPKSHTGSVLADVARLIRAGVGLQTATVDLGAWDLHSNLGKAGTGAMAGLAGDLAGALAAFAADLGPLLGRVVVVTLTEFGRQAAENVTAGTDHGHGYGMFVLGGAVNGGRVFTTWPTLAAGALDGGALRATTDYRQVLGEVLSVRCGVNPTTVFPDVVPAPLGVVRA